MAALDLETALAFTRPASSQPDLPRRREGAHAPGGRVSDTT